MKVFLIGFMGCGKTHWGRLLSRKLGIPFFDLDERIEEKEEKTITAIFAEDGEEYFRLLEKEVLYFLTESHDSFVMATGGGTPCYYNNIRYMKEAGTAIWINCSLDIAHGRLLEEREKRPLIRALNSDQLRSYIIKKFSDRKIFYEQADRTLHDETLQLDDLVQTVFHA